MISVCATIHRSAKSCEAFIRSIYDNATGEDFEVLLISDRNFPAQEDSLRQLAASFPRLPLIEIGADRQFITNWRRLDFWSQVYGRDIAEYAKLRLAKMHTHQIDLWLQYAYGLNLAAREANGDLLLLTPADFFVMCDLQRLNQKCLERAVKDKGRFFGHFSLVAPFERSPTSMRDVFVGSELFGHDIRAIETWLAAHHLYRSEYPVTEPVDRYWPFNHGIRVVDRKTFFDVGGLRDDFLSKPGPTNIFNRMARAIAYGPEEARRKRSIEELTGFRARMASVPLDDDPAIEYLYPNPCDGDTVRTMQYAEEKWVRENEPRFKEIF